MVKVTPRLLDSEGKRHQPLGRIVVRLERLVFAEHKYLHLAEIELVACFVVSSYSDIIFMRAIYNYVPETNYISRVHSVATVLYLQFVQYNVISHAKYVL